MPQQSTNQWIVNYNGYQFNMTHPTEPTEEDAKWAYNQYVLGDSSLKDSTWVADSTNWMMPAQDTLPSLNFGYVETDVERAKRNAQEIGSSVPDQEYRDATFMGRFWDSVKASAIPFGKYESTLSPPDESSELWASAFGGLIGAVPSFILASAVTGGVGGIAATGARGAKAVTGFRKFLKAKDAAAKAAKAGRISKVRFETLAENIAKRNTGVFAKAVAAKEMPHLTGVLGRIKPYRNKILKIAEKNPKLARALNLFSNNVVAFNLYGQTRFPIDKIEGRLHSLASDTAAGLVFSVAGIPTMVGATSKGVKYALEPGMLVGAGMYSDLMQSDMSMEERFIHGISLGIFHYARQGLSKANIKQKLETAIRTTIPEIGDSQLKNIVESKGVDKIFDSTNDLLVNKQLQKMHFYNVKEPGKNVRILRIYENKKGKKPKWEVMFEDIESGTVNRVSAKTREEAVLKFREKYIPNTPNVKGERVVGRKLDKLDKKILNDLGINEKHFRAALASGRRDYTVNDTGKSGAAPEVETPFQNKRGTSEVNRIQNKIDSFENELIRLKAKRVEDLADKPEFKISINHQYNQSTNRIKKSLKTLRKQLSEKRGDLKVKDVEFFQDGKVPEQWKIGDYIKIPFWNENTKSFDFSLAGIGKYIGKISDFKKGDVIIPEGLGAEFKSQNYPVFEIRTHGGSRVQKIAIGGKMPAKIAEKIAKAKQSDRPEQSFDSENPEIRGIKNEPIVKEENGRLVYNSKSPLFSKLFTDKLSGKDAAERGEQSIEVDMAEPYMVKRGKKASLSDRLADSEQKITDPENALLKITVPRPKSPTKVYPRSASGLKNVSKIFEEGLTPERALSFEESHIQKIRDKSSVEREKARSDWERLRNVDEKDPNAWFDMNQMSPDILIDRKTYESYPEFDPLNEKPFTIKTEYDKIVDGKPVKVEMGESDLGGKPLRFRTRKEATEWAETHWMQNEGLESQIKMIIDERASINQATAGVRKEQSKLEKTKRESAASDNEFRQLLSLFFPKSEGSSKNMTYEELVSANALFKTKTNTLTFENTISSTVPPDKFMSKVGVQWRKFLVGAAKIVLPTYTVLGMVKSKAAQVLAGKQIDFELMRQSLSGQVEQWKAQLRKDYKLNQKQFEALSSILDGKYKDFYDPILDGVPKQEIINDYRVLSDGLLIAMMQNSVEVKNARKGGSPELMFEAYDKNGVLIQLDVPWDALRVVKGYQFLDSAMNTKMPSNLKKKVDLDYLKSLRVKNEVTGEYDNGWYIIGKERFVPEWKGDKLVRIRKLGSGEIDTAEGRRNVKMYEDVNGKKAGFKNHIEENYLMRMVTDEFRDLIGMDNDFRKAMALRISQTDPQFARMKGTPQERFLAALAHVNSIKNYWMDSAGVFGTQWSRIAELPPSILLERGTNNIIDVTNFKDIGGKTVKKGSTVIDKHGNKKEVGRIIEVYERNFDKIITRYGQKVAHIVPTYKYFGRGGAQNQGNTADLFAKLTLETNESFSDWAKSQLELQVNSTQKNNPMEKILTPLTMVTAQLGLSSPLSGVKNFILGQTSNATVYGFRGALSGLYESMSSPLYHSKMASLIGAKEAGVHALMSGRVRYTKYSLGLMRQTEIVNRIVSVAAARPMLETHINNLNGIKTVMNRGMSKKTSMRTMTEVFKFTDAEVKNMMKLGIERLHENPAYLERAQQMSHLITQGGPSLPFVPKWMGKWWAKPMTLFYRIAYRMSENVVNSVVKPAVIDGNPVPLLRYMTIVPIAGQALYAMYYGVLGEEQRNKFKTKSEEYWMQFLKAEGLAMLSNGFDELGGTVESYKPVVYRTVESLFRETAATVTGKKKIEQSLEDLAKENIVFLNHATRVTRRFTAPLEKKVEASKRRQRQFVDVYFRTNPVFGDEIDFLTTRSPYYRTVKDSFWSDDPEIKAKAYYSALNYVIHDEIKKDPALIKQPHKARKMAKTILKSLVSRSRPIPSSWRKKTTGKKTRYQVYYSKLKPEFQKEELELDRLYKQKVREFNSAINRYRSKYGMDAVIAPTEK